MRVIGPDTEHKYWDKDNAVVVVYSGANIQRFLEFVQEAVKASESFPLDERVFELVIGGSPKRINNRKRSL